MYDTAVVNEMANDLNQIMAGGIERNYHAAVPRDLAERQAKARAEYATAIESLSPQSSDEEAEAVASLIVDAELKPLQRERAVEKFQKALGFRVKGPVAKLLAHAEQRRAAEQREADEDDDDRASEAGYPLPPHVRRISVIDHENGRRYFARKDGSPLCTLLTIVGGARYPDRSNERDLEIAFENDIGEREVVRIPAESIPNQKQVISILRGRSVAFWDDEAERWLHRLLMNEQPPPRVLYDFAGFRNGAYLTACGAVFLADPATVGLSDQGRGPNGAPATHGDLEGWKAGAKGIFDQKQSMSLKAALLIGFVGPALALAGNPSVVFIFTGEHGGGKSFRQEIGVAVSGPFKAGVGQLRSMRTTANGLEIPLQRAAGGILALDEMKGCTAEDVQDMIFMIYGGVGKSRMTTQITERAVARWDGAAVTMSAEVGLAQQLRQSKALRAGGLSARMIEVPVEAAEHITDAATFAEVLKARDNYGVAIGPFVEALYAQGYVADPQTLRDAAEVVVRRLGLQHPNMKRQARALAYLEVVGDIAQRAGLIPNDANVAAVVDHIWERYLASEIGDTDVTGRAIANVVGYLGRHRGMSVICPALGEEPRRAVEAWRVPADPKKLMPDDLWRYVIPVEVLSKMAAGEAAGFAEDQQVIKALHAQGYAVRAPEQNRRTWRNYRGVYNGACVVLRAEKVEADASAEALAPEAANQDDAAEAA